MNPTTAVGLILAGVSLALWQAEHDRRMRSACPGDRRLVLLVGLAQARQTSSSAGTWPIDQFLFRDKLDTDLEYANRMAPTTAIGFALLGLALACVNVETHRRLRPAQFLSLLVALIALLAVVGHLYGVRGLTGLQFYIPMAFHTAVAFLVLAGGILCLRPDRGFMARVIGDSPGGILIRRIVLAVIGIPVLLGWLIATGQQRRLVRRGLCLCDLRGPGPRGPLAAGLGQRRAAGRKRGPTQAGRGGGAAAGRGTCVWPMSSWNRPRKRRKPPAAPRAPSWRT